MHNPKARIKIIPRAKPQGKAVGMILIIRYGIINLFLASLAEESI